MDKLFANVPAASTGGPEVTVGQKRVAVAMIDDHSSITPAQQGILNTTIKMTLATALRTRVLAAVSYQTFNVPLANSLVQEMLKATKQFSEVQKKMREPKSITQDEIKEKLGIPCIHAFMGMATHTAENNTLKEQLQAAMEEWNKMAVKEGKPLWQFLSQQIKLFKLEKMFSSDREKLVVKLEGECRVSPKVEGISPREMWEYYIKPNLMAGGAKELIGVAPPGELERVLQAHLDK